MALRYLDGFGTYATAQLIGAGKFTGATNGASSNFSITSSAARYGTAGLRKTQRRYYVYKDVTDELGAVIASDTWTVGFAFRWSNGSADWTNGIVAAWYDSGGTIQCELRLSSGFQLYVTRNGTTIASGTRAIEANRWYYIEWTLVIGDSPNGSTVVVVDQVEDINATSLDTRNGIATAQRFRIGADINEGNGCPIDHADLYIADDATRRGDCRVDVLRPDGAGTHADWTGAATDVDDTTPDDDTTYATSATAGHRSTFTLGALPAGAVSVKGVAVNHRIRKDDAGARTARALVRSGTTDDPGDTFSVSDSYAWRQGVWEQNPDTGAAWSVAAVNALEAGAEVVS